MAESVVIPEYEVHEATTRRIFLPARELLFVLLVCAGYLVGALIGKSLRFPESHLSLIWPPTAIVMAALILAPPRKWWLYLFAVTPVHILIQMQDNVPEWAILSQLLGNFGQALLAAAAVRYVEHGGARFDNFRGVLVFSLCAAFAAPLFVSSIVAYFYVLSGWEQDYWYVWRARVLSNVLSTLTIVPPVLLGASAIAQARKVTPWRFVEAGSLAAGLVLLGLTALHPNSAVAVLLYAPLPFLLWAAVRFGIGGLCLSILVTAYIVFLDASGGQGPFAAQSPAENVLSLQLFLITISLPLMFLAALIEERREKEKALGESEARYRALVMAGAEMVCRADADGKGLFVHPSWQDLTGQSEEEIRNLGWLNAVHPSDRERSGRLWEEAVAAKRTYENELRVRARDGSYRHFHVHAVPILAPDGSVHEWVGANTDITERKRAEEALRESEERLARTEKFSLVMVTHTDLEGRWIKVPPTLCELLGYTEEELLGRRFHDVTHPDDIEANSRQHLRLIQGEVKSFDLEKRYIRKNGSLVWVYLNVSVVTNTEGRPVHFLSYIRDITARKRAEARANTQYAVSRILSESDSIVSAAPRVIQSICESLDWESGEIWRVDGQNNFLIWLTSWHLSSRDLEEFASASPQFTFRRGVSLPGRVWESGKPAWISDLASDSNFPRASLATKAGLRSAFSVPILVGHEVLGVMAFFGGEVQEPDEDLLQMMASIGSQIGQFTERKRAEEEAQQLKERLEAENVYLRAEVSGAHRFGELTGQSEAIENVIHQVEQVAATDMTVLLLGETGTGKELMAQAVHAHSTREDRPLVKVNCSALPSELIESELFGHEKGAFTGATARQIGRFELADGATIFLDEIGELPLKLQTKLLRVLQEGEFERLGSGKTIKVDVRVIAATNRDLVEAIRRGRFRADLYYRLNVYPIHLPPLRERKEDIDLLATTFLKEASRRLGRTFDSIPLNVIEVLRRYDWPGNVRELQNVIERSAVISTGRVLQLPSGWELPLARTESSGTSMARGEAGMPVNGQSVKELTLDQFERAHIIQVLEQTGWRIEGARGAALILGLNPSTLRSRMKKLGIRSRRQVRSPTAERMH